jgi:hypothetical protein
VLAHFGFHHDVTDLGPRLRRIGKGVKELYALLRSLKPTSGLVQRCGSKAEQDGILGQAHDVGDAAQLPIQFLQHPQYARDRKRRIAAHDNLDVRKALLQPPNNPP